MKPTVGRIVHYHFRNRRETITTRPAIVVSVIPESPESRVNLRVFYDGNNDAPVTSDGEWMGSVPQLADGAEPEHGRWSWPPKA